MASRALLAVRVGTIVALLTFLVLMVEVNAYSMMGGRRFKGDGLLFRNNTRVPVRESAQYNRVCYPTSPSTRVNITMFEVMDLMPFGRGGTPYLWDGGVNGTSICFLLMCKPHQAYNFTISLWGFRL